jgi:hypothetical protein
MSWLEHLADELTSIGVTGRERRRIVVELRDHIVCEPGCEDRLGDPRQLAANFADELATDRARRSAFSVFLALALAAVALLVSQLSLGHAGGYPGYNRGLSLALFLPAALGMFIAPQVALVAGTLAALRAARRRRARILPAAEIALIRRRAWVGLGAGAATVAGLELYVVNFSSVLPGWWLALIGGLSGMAGVALVAASRRLVLAGAVITRTSGRAGDVYDDLPVIRWDWLRRHPWRLGAIASLGVGVSMTLFEAHAEHSLFEGVQRGAMEGLAAAAGFALLGRAIGVGTATSETARLVRERAALSRQLELGVTPPGISSDQRVGDEDRSRAELVLRENFGHGRLSLDELTTRVAAVHEARTIGQLRAALGGLADEQ